LFLFLFRRWLFGDECCQFFAFLQQFFGMSQVAAVTILAVERVVVVRCLSSGEWACPPTRPSKDLYSRAYQLHLEPPQNLILGPLNTSVIINCGQVLPSPTCIAEVFLSLAKLLLYKILCTYVSSITYSFCRGEPLKWDLHFL